MREHLARQGSSGSLHTRPTAGAPETASMHRPQASDLPQATDSGVVRTTTPKRPQGEDSLGRRAPQSHPPGLTSSVLYMPIPTPPAGKLYTSHSLAPLPSFGEKTILNVPARSTTKSVALYCRDKSRAQARGAKGGGPGPWEPSPASCRAHLVAVGVPADGDGLGPARDEAWDVLADDGFPEDGPS